MIRTWGAIIKLHCWILLKYIHWIATQKSEVLFICLSPIIPMILSPFMVANWTITRSLPTDKLTSLPYQLASGMRHFWTTKIKCASVAMQNEVPRQIQPSMVNSWPMEATPLQRYYFLLPRCISLASSFTSSILVFLAVPFLTLAQSLPKEKLVKFRGKQTKSSLLIISLHLQIGLIRLKSVI